MGGLWYVVIVFFTLFFLRLPIALVLISATIVGLWFAPSQIPFSTLPTTLWQGINHFVLMAIPFFILMGDLALASGVTQRLVNLAKAFVGHIAGGLAHVGVIVNVIMAGMSGSDLADAAATGRILIPAMQRSGYPVGYAASLIAGAATIGPLIPPSIAFILFAAATDESVGRLFLGGAIPGAMLGLFLMLQAYVVAKRNNYPREARMPYRERLTAMVVGLPVLVIPVVVLGSILAGIATPTEAAVLGVVAVIGVGGFLYRELSLATFTRQMLSTHFDCITNKLWQLLNMLKCCKLTLQLFFNLNQIVLWKYHRT